MFFTPLLDFFLPRLCYCCDNKLEPEENSVCSVCSSKMKFADSGRISYEYNKDFRGKGIVSGFSSLLVFEKDKEVQHLIHSLKYKKKFHAGIYLGEITGSALRTQISNWKTDLIIPVPLHKLKEIERGFNQSCYIAKGISRMTGIECNKKVLKRKKNTLSQTQMNLIQREENIKDAFNVKQPEAVKDKIILLVDDVITTGSTINECGRVLLEAGAAEIYAVSAAVADLNKVEFDPAADID
jgi:ComF family protein